MLKGVGQLKSDPVMSSSGSVFHKKSYIVLVVFFIFFLIEKTKTIPYLKLFFKVERKLLGVKEEI